MRTISKFQSIMMALCMALCLSACSESNNDEPDGPVKPDEPVAGEWLTVPSAGGNFNVGDITLQFDPSTFDGDVKVGISEVKASEITEDGRSNFYQLILPPSGAKKPFKVKLDCTGSTVNVRPMVKTIAWDPHSGTKSQVVFDIDGSVIGNQIEATIPGLSSDGQEKPYFTIGLAECPPVEETRADSLRFQYKVGATIWKYNANREKYKEISEIVENVIHESDNLLSEVGFKTKTFVQYRLSSPEDVTGLKECWGVHKPSVWDKSWNVVHLNEDYFLDYIGDKTDKKLNDLKATIIHETLHAITALLYDPRSGWRICREGEKGNDWSQFDEGLGCWVEKFIGAKEISENTEKWQKNFIREFYPHTRDQFACRDCGYGMASFIEFMAQKAGDTKIVDIYKAFKDVNTSFRTVLKSFLAGNSIQFFDHQSYYNFAFSVMNNKIVPQIDIDDCVSSIEGQEGKVDIMKEKDYTLKADAYNYGVLVHMLNFTTDYLKKNQDSLVSINQYNPGVLTRIYYKKNNELTLLGQCTDDDNFVIDMKDINKKTGIYGDTPPSHTALYFVTTRNEFKDDYSSMPSYIKIRVMNGEVEEADEFEVSPTEVEADAKNGGNFTFTVNKGKFKEAGYFIEGDRSEWSDFLDPKTYNKSNNTFEIGVWNNISNKPRIYSGIVVWAADKNYLLLDKEKDKYEETRITVKQPAYIRKGDVTRVKIISVLTTDSEATNIFGATVNSYINTEDETNTITTERIGNGLKVTAERNKRSMGYDYRSTITFTIPEYSEYGGISELRDLVMINEDVANDDTPDDMELSDRVEIVATSIPFNDYREGEGFCNWKEEYKEGTSNFILKYYKWGSKQYYWYPTEQDYILVDIDFSGE